MKTIRLFLPIIFFLLVTCISAQIYFKNNNAEPVYVAFARYINGNNGGYWQTQGWWTVNPGNTHLAFEAIGTGDSIGYWCMTTLSTDKYEGTKSLLVHPDEKFTIRKADLETTGRNHSDWEWYKFRLIRLKPGMTTGTIPFKD